MSAAVMSNYLFPSFGQGHGADSEARVQSWMLAQMAQYPPPPQPDQQHHYNALYPVSTGAQQLVEPQEALQFSHLTQPVYAKAETTSPDQAHAGNSNINRLAQELHQQAAFEGQQQQPHVQHGAQPHLQQQIQAQPTVTPRSSQAPTQHSSAEQQSQKSNRLRKACDSCSIRKVKCDESGPPCRACASLDIPCTFDRPSRRRGPPNRHAEAIKRRRMKEAAAAAAGGSPSLSAVSVSSPSSPTHAARALAALSSQTSNPHLSAESICPLEVLDVMIDDFFTYIHPLCPFPHEPSFREAWKHREDLTNGSFLALLSSMIATLVASYPRRPRQHLKAARKEHLFSNHMSFINRCQKVCAAARGPGYLESENLNVYDAATSYFIALVGTYTYRWRQARLYFGECLTIIRTLGLHKTNAEPLSQASGRHNSDSSLGRDTSGEIEPSLDCITREMGRRVFWTLFVGIKSCSQFGADFSELIMPPPTPSESYPPFPMEVDDFCIYPNHIEPQPEGLLPEIIGFIANVRVFASYQAISKMEMAWGIDAVVDWDRQRRVLYEALRRCKDAVAELPPPLVVNPNIQPMQGVFPNFGSGNDPTNFDQSQSMEDPQTPEQRRQMQCEIQKANIYASCLATRSYIVQKYWNLCEARERSRSQSRQNSPGTGITQAGLDGLLPLPPTSEQDLIDHEMKHERESIVKDLLTVLSTIREVHMEPNADSFTMKVRCIAGTLLDAPDERKGQLADEARQYLGTFLKILMRLERVSPANSDPDQPEDEESELRAWADLREYQMKFAQQGGILGVA